MCTLRNKLVKFFAENKWQDSKESSEIEIFIDWTAQSYKIDVLEPIMKQDGWKEKSWRDFKSQIEQLPRTLSDDQFGDPMRPASSYAPYKCVKRHCGCCL